MQNKGFAQPIILLLILAGLGLAFGAGIFIQKNDFFSQRESETTQTEPNADSVMTGSDAENSGEIKYGELEFLRNEIEALKKAQSGPPPELQPKQESLPRPTKRELSNAEIVTKVKPAVVYLDADESVGSGFFIGNSEILTNAHVVEGVSTLEVVTQGGLRMQGTVQGRDEILDVALIKVNAQRVSDLNLELGDSSRAHQGDEVFAFGFPFGIEGDVSFKEGTISRTLGEGDASLFETSVEIHPGNSGGPLVDRYGSVIGINNARFGKSVSGVSLGETIKFAIPINVVQQQLADLRAGANVVKEKKAGGGIVIVNDTNFEQTLVATTRFKSEEGYIYRITETVVIPAHSLVEAPVLADKDGKQYELNCSIKTCYFTIPGFIGSSRHYDIFGLATKNLYIGNELPNVSDPVPIGKSNTNKTTTSYFPPKSSIPPESLSFDEKDRWCSQKHGLFSVYDSALNVCGCTEGRGPSKDSIWECIDIAAMCKRWFGAGAQRKAEASFFNFSMEATDLCYCFNSEWSKDFTQCII